MIQEFPARPQIEDLEMKNYLLAMISILASAFSHAESVPLTLAWNASEGAATYRVYSLYASDGQMHLIRYGIKETQVTITNFDTTGKRFVQVTAVSKEGLESDKSNGITVRQVRDNGVTHWVEEPSDLTVFNGSGSGDYPVGSQVMVSANPAPPGQSFARWAGDTEILSNPFLSRTSATIPSISVAITATYH